MSSSVENPIQEQQQHRNDVASNACSNQPSLQLDSQDDSPPLTLRKRSSAHAGFAMASYNSAFLEDLFGDIAVASSESPSLLEPQEEPETAAEDAQNPADDEPTLSEAVASDHNLSKRRRVSTNKSLGRCSKSLANLASFAAIRRKHSSVLHSASVDATITTAPKKDLPATVSASYSFTLDLLLVSREQASPKQKQREEQDQEGDFGWFVDTDESPAHNTVPTNSPCCGTSTVPLAFSAPTAPVAHSQGHPAEVEWAQAADTIDEVLGDFF